MLDDWVKLLRASLDDEFSAAAPRVCTLATVRADDGGGGGAAARTVICRHISRGGVLHIVSDARSAKNQQAARERRGEAVFWLPKRREQFRIAGSVVPVEDAEVRRTIWRMLTDASRGLFLWPTPGTPFDASAEFPTALSADSVIPPTFVVLGVGPQTVEYLNLNVHPHDRRRWDWRDGWTEQRLNP